MSKLEYHNLVTYEMTVNGQFVMAHSFIPKEQEPKEFLKNYYNNINEAAKRENIDESIEVKFDTIQIFGIKKKKGSTKNGEKKNNQADEKNEKTIQ